MAGDDSGLGFAFWAKIAGGIIVIGIAGLILMLLITSAVYAFGFLGALVAFAAVLLLIRVVLRPPPDRGVRRLLGPARRPSRVPQTA